MKTTENYTDYGEMLDHAIKARLRDLKRKEEEK